jgi:hypothetical protein
MAVGRSPSGEGALMVVLTSGAVDATAVDKLQRVDGVSEVAVLARSSDT